MQRQAEQSPVDFIVSCRSARAEWSLFSPGKAQTPNSVPSCWIPTLMLCQCLRWGWVALGLQDLTLLLSMIWRLIKRIRGVRMFRKQSSRKGMAGLWCTKYSSSLLPVLSPWYLHPWVIMFVWDVFIQMSSAPVFFQSNCLTAQHVWLSSHSPGMKINSATYFLNRI